ncbi:MAG: acyl-CoA dehydrogenase [Dehalococcoidia bacterium]|nr:acyl-CoA dehydrogenase [Dehalococcoidia bacterium]
MLRLNEDDILDDDLRGIRDAVERLCRDFDTSYWAKQEEKRAYPEEFVQALQDGDWLSISIPEEFGGGGMGIRAGAVVLEAVTRSGCFAAAAHAQLYTMGAILRHGSDAQKKKYLPGIAAGELRLQAFGITEPDAGSETTKISTRALRDGDHYVINGSKVFISRFFHSDLMLLLTRTTPYDEVEKKTDGISLFLVDLREAGDSIQATPIRTMVNHETAALHIENLRVPAENLIGEEGKGFRCILSGLNSERIIVASEHIGAGLYLLERASKYASERVVFDRPIGSNQGVQFPLARAYADLSAASLVRWRACDLYEQGKQPGYEANTAKLLASTAKWAAANAAMDTFGGYGMATEYGIEAKFREARLSLVAPINNNLTLAFIATNVLGMPRSY